MSIRRSLQVINGSNSGGGDKPSGSAPPLSAKFIAPATGKIAERPYARLKAGLCFEYPHVYSVEIPDVIPSEFVDTYFERNISALLDAAQVDDYKRTYDEKSHYLDIHFKTREDMEHFYIAQNAGINPVVEVIFTASKSSPSPQTIYMHFLEAAKSIDPAGKKLKLDGVKVDTGYTGDISVMTYGAEDYFEFITALHKADTKKLSTLKDVHIYEPE